MEIIYHQHHLWTTPSLDPPKHKTVYFPDMTKLSPSQSAEFRRVLWTVLYSQLSDDSARRRKGRVSMSLPNGVRRVRRRTKSGDREMNSSTQVSILEEYNKYRSKLRDQVVLVLAVLFMLSVLGPVLHQVRLPS
jgi:hypothetical protein